MKKYNRLALRVAALFIIDLVQAADLELAGVAGIDGRIQPCQWIFEIGHFPSLQRLLTN
jgi:hypothetical protein